jgi:hypothetical protein
VPPVVKQSSKPGLPGETADHIVNAPTGHEACDRMTGSKSGRSMSHRIFPETAGTLFLPLHFTLMTRRHEIEQMSIAGIGVVGFAVVTSSFLVALWVVDNGFLAEPAKARMVYFGKPSSAIISAPTTAPKAELESAIEGQPTTTFPIISDGNLGG